MDNLGYGATIYVAGPMRLHHCYNFKRFFYHQVMLENSGYKVINPAELDCLRWINDGWIFSEDQYEVVMAIDLALIEHSADAVFALKGWEDSPGATREIGLAINLGKPVYYEDQHEA
jgi:nucleoside 2-deoxyribosyltransferase